MRKSNAEWPTRLQSPSDVDIIYSPKNWNYVTANPEKAYYADCPVMYDIIERFGEEYACFWVQAQISAMFAMSANKDKGTVNGIKMFADSFAMQVKTYKLTELMLFFSRYRAGKYDDSFATFDSRRIGRAFFSEFRKERQYELDKYHRAREQEEIEKRRFTPPEGYTSWTWYQEIKKRAESGDIEAQAALQF